jgi:hypothetical protein
MGRFFSVYLESNNKTFHGWWKCRMMDKIGRKLTKMKINGEILLEWLLLLLFHLVQVELMIISCEWHLESLALLMLNDWHSRSLSWSEVFVVLFWMIAAQNHSLELKCFRNDWHTESLTWSEVFPLVLSKWLSSRIIHMKWCVRDCFWNDCHTESLTWRKCLWLLSK